MLKQMHPNLPGIVIAALPLVSLAFGQGGTFTLAETVMLPSTGEGDADHATVAMNDAGDVFVTWSAARPDLSANASQVEGVYLRYLGGSRWEQAQVGYNHWVLGAADAAVYGGSYESCRKPDVVAVGTEFVITWPRSNFERTTSRLEVVRVLTSPSAPPVLDAPAFGVGYVADPDVKSEDAGGMPDLVKLASNPTKVSVVYVHDAKITPPYREYDLRYVRVTFPALGSVTVDGPGVIVDNLPFDDAPNTGEPAGGKVLPDVELDDWDNMVVAFETYARQGHQGAGVNEGRIYVQWYRNGVTGQPSLISDNEVDYGDNLHQHFYISGRRASDRTRRPNLATSRLDTGNTVSLAFLDAPDSTGDVDVEHRLLTWNGAAITMTDFVYPNLGNVNDNVPVPVHGSTLRGVLSVREDTVDEDLKAFVPSLPNTPFPTLNVPIAHPWRPAVDLLEPAPADVPNATLLVPVTYEGPGIGVTGLRIYLVIHKR